MARTLILGCFKYVSAMVKIHSYDENVISFIDIDNYMKKVCGCLSNLFKRKCLNILAWLVQYAINYSSRSRVWSHQRLRMNCTRRYSLNILNFRNTCLYLTVNNFTLNWWKGKPSESIACTRKQQPRFSHAGYASWGLSLSSV